MCPTDRETKQALDSNVDRLQEAFKVLDRDGDGIIATSDLELFLHQVAASKLISKEHVRSMLAMVEGDVDFEQFLRLLQYQPENNVSVISTEENDEAFRAMFQVFDKNGDGLICEEDLKTFMNTVGRSLSEKDIQSMLKGHGAGAAGSIEGKVSYQDFVVLMTSPRPRRFKLNDFSFLQTVPSY